MKTILTPIFLVNLFISLLSCVFAHAGTYKNEIKIAEVQFEICEPSAEIVALKLDLALTNKKSKNVFYYDTAKKNLIQQNVVIKINQSDTKFKSSAKVKDLAEKDIPWKKLKDHDHKCELDVYLYLSRISCSLNHDMKNSNDVLSHPQIDFMETTRLDHLDEDLQRYGPVMTSEYTLLTEKQSLILETSTVRNTLAAIELSARVTKEEAQSTQSEILLLLNKAQIQLCDDQEGKIKRILSLLSLNE